MILQSSRPNYDFWDVFIYERAGNVLLDPTGTVIALTLVLVIGIGVANSRLPRSLKHLVYIALAFRVIGALSRYVVLFSIYRGSGDARHYYRRGVEYADHIWRLDFAPIFDQATWWGRKWHGTQFVYFPSGIVHTFIGSSMPGGFIVFSLLSFAGLVGFVVAFSRAYPDVPVTRYARWVWLFPALWYWPSSIGKEAIILFGLGMAVMAYAGKGGRINWLQLVIGLFFVYAIRPEMAAVVILSMIIAHWLSLLRGRWTVGTAVQAAILIGGGLVGIYLAMQKTGMVGDDGSVHGYLEGNQARDVGGGSELDAAPVGITGIPLALINILMRPFPWEARSFMMAITAVEILAFWVIVWIKRKNVLRSLRHWRSDRLLRVAIPFILIYSITLGMVMGNMAIIARQRIFLFPFLFLLAEAVPRAARRRVPARHSPQPGYVSTAPPVASPSVRL
ncbi:hypothetical protein BH23GEM6_BH23GEM6_18120 [soil metagenome]